MSVNFAVQATNEQIRPVMITEEERQQLTRDVEPAKPLQLDKAQMTIEVPTQLHRDYWEKNLAAKFTDIAMQATNEQIRPVMITEE
ncbi:hypothetical protein WP50_17500, partial [Lactiplantibacillus plantarum]